MNRPDASRSRQRLRQSGEQYQRQLELLLEERGPLIRGSAGTRTRVCGKPTCRCTRGELHESVYLSASEEGTVRQVHVPAADVAHVKAGAHRYRRFQKARQQLARLARQQLELVDALGRSLLAPYPPDKPLPPAQRRGRKRGGSAGGR